MVGFELGQNGDVGQKLLEEFCNLIESGELGRAMLKALDVVTEWIHLESVLKFLRKNPRYPPEPPEE